LYKIAIVGATSQIARDFILSLRDNLELDLLLYARNLPKLNKWLKLYKLEGRYSIENITTYGDIPHDAVINFVGVGDPAALKNMDSSILDITAKYDDLILNRLKKNPSRKYIFLSSGAVYGSNFESPVSHLTHSSINVNNLNINQHYSVAKLYAECKHRALKDLSIIDLRIFSYFSDSTNLNSKFFLTDIISSIKSKQVLETSQDDMVRDYLHKLDFLQMVQKILTAPQSNEAFDCYSKAYISKDQLLNFFSTKYGLQYRINNDYVGHELSEEKAQYYSTNLKASSIGYKPQFTSLETVEEFSEQLLA